MSWRLFKNTIEHPGHEYSLQTIPTLSSALDFDVRQNQPDFGKMLDKRMAQACLSEEVKEAYQKAYGYDDYDISQLDIDIYASEIMDNINAQMLAEKEEDEDDIFMDDMYDDGYYDKAEDNTKEQQQAIKQAEQKFSVSNDKRFARGKLAPSDLISEGGYPNHGLDKILISAYIEARGYMEQDTLNFRSTGDTLCGINGEVYVRHLTQSYALQKLNEEAKDENSRVFAEGDINEHDLNQFGSYMLTDDFYKFLASQNAWTFAGGRFDQAVNRAILNNE